MSDLARRRPVWVAISDLCLDTEITDETIHHIARTIREQGYSAAEAEEIAFHEVFPALHPNMLSPAGEWAGFNEEWLVNQILQKNKTRKSRLRLWWERWFYQCTMKKDWARVRDALDKL